MGFVFVKSFKNAFSGEGGGGVQIKWLKFMNRLRKQTIQTRTRALMNWFKSNPREQETM